MVFIDGGGESVLANMFGEALKKVTVEADVEVAHEDRNIFRGVVVEKCMELIPERMFSLLVTREILQLTRSVYREGRYLVWTSIEYENCKAAVPWKS